MKYVTHFRLLLLTLLWLPAAAHAQLIFTTNSGAITITGFSGSPTNVVIPATTNGYPVTGIGNSAFYSCASLMNVIIPDSVTSIGNEAFEFCTSLTGVTLGNGVTSIGDGAFYYCFNLMNVIIPNSVTNLGAATFADCFRMTNVMIPNSVTSIGASAFATCSNLTSVSIPNRVTNIGNDAFGGCSELRSVTIPNSVTSIGNGAFQYCSSLTNITVGVSNPAYSSLGGVLFDQAQTTLLQCPGALAGSYLLPNSVTSISPMAFAYCLSLTSVTIPDSVTSIGSDAFLYCLSLTKVMIGTGLTSIGPSAFIICPALAGVYFQGNSPTPTSDTGVFSGDPNAIVYYLAGTTSWSSVFDGRPTVMLAPPPPVGIAMVGQLPLIVYPPSGTNYVLQMSTNLASDNWVAVTNEVVVPNGVQITNPPANSFFRLHGPFPLSPN